MAVDIHQIPNIIEFVCHAWPVRTQSLASLAHHLTPQHFPRRSILVREGAQEGKVWFIESGMTRSYWLVDGDEITTSFSVAGCVVFSMDEVYYSRPSQEFVESIGPVEAFGINVDTLLHLISTDIDLANWWRVIHQNEYRRLHQSHKEQLTLPASLRYKAFHAQFPLVCRSARLTDIASYLGISPSTLSRVRRKHIF